MQEFCFFAHAKSGCGRFPFRNAVPQPLCCSFLFCKFFLFPLKQNHHSHQCGQKIRNRLGWILCRSALASGKKRVWDEAVLYRTVEIEDGTGEAGGQAAGERAPDGASGSEREGESWLSLLFRAAALMLSLGLLLLAAAALAAWIRKKKKEKEEEKKSPDGI